MEEVLNQDVIREIVSMVRFSPLGIQHYTGTIRKEDCNWFYEGRTGEKPKESFSVKRAVLLELWRRNTIFNLINLGELIIGEK